MIAYGIFAVRRTSRSSASEDDFVVVGFFGFHTKSTKHERISSLNCAEADAKRRQPSHEAVTQVSS